MLLKAGSCESKRGMLLHNCSIVMLKHYFLVVGAAAPFYYRKGFGYLAYKILACYETDKTNPIALFDIFYLIYLFMMYRAQI